MPISSATCSPVSSSLRKATISAPLAAAARQMGARGDADLGARGRSASPQSPSTAAAAIGRRCRDEQGGQQPRQPRQPQRRLAPRRDPRSGTRRNGPFSGVARSSAGSASAIALGEVEPGRARDQHRHGRDRRRAGWRASASPRGCRRSAGRPAAPASNAAEPASSAVSIASRPRPSDRDRPAAPQRVDRAGDVAALRSNRELGDQRHMVGRPRPAAARLVARDARRPASRRPRSPTYGRAGGRGRSWSSRASDSSTRCAAAAAPDGNGGRDRPSRCSSCSRVSASTSIGVWLTTLSSCLWLHTSHSSGATLKSPTRMVGQRAGFRPAGHPLDEVELLAELGIDGRGRACRRRPGHRRSRAGCRIRAARRCGAPRHWPASRAAPPRASAAG